MSRKAWKQYQAAVTACADYTPNDKFAFRVLASFADHGTGANCRPTYAKLAARSGQSEKWWKRRLRVLKTLGLITTLPLKHRSGRWGPNLYSFGGHGFQGPAEGPRVRNERALGPGSLDKPPPKYLRMREGVNDEGGNMRETKVEAPAKVVRAVREVAELEFVGGPCDGSRIFLTVLRDGDRFLRVIEKDFEGPPRAFSDEDRRRNCDER